MAYAAKAAVTVDVNALAYYRLWYDLDEIGGYVAMFQQPHDETADTTESWSNLQHYLRPAERWPEVVD